MRRAERLGARVVTPGDESYPACLRDAPLRPLVLFARGDLDLLNRRPATAVVGSRTPTPYGQTAAEEFASALARAGIAVWSGLAIGVDAIAHRAALAHGGRTVAVLAGGLDSIYPAAHQGLARRIAAEHGLLISEMPPGRRAQRGHFPRRNRILAWTPDAVLVVEAGHASGSLHTARFAAELGIPVFAVPGPYSSPRSRGCHALIADGAQIACDPEDLLRRLGVEAGGKSGGAELELGADETAILAALAQGPRPSDLIERESGLEAGRYLAALLSLTEKGCVRAMPGDLLARVSPPARAGGRA